MRGTALAGFDKQFSFDQIKKIPVRGVVGHVKGLATPTAGDYPRLLDLNHLITTNVGHQTGIQPYQLAFNSSSARFA
jgi:hypothetical protein